MTGRRSSGRATWHGATSAPRESRRRLARIVWYVQGSSRLSGAASSALAESERTEGIVVSVATFVDLWYVTQTTQAVSPDDLTRLHATLDASAIVDLQVIDVVVADAFTPIPRSVLTDPWDRFIVATAKALAPALGDA